MRALLQRTTGARVRVDGATVGEIEKGLVVLLGVGPELAERLYGRFVGALRALDVETATGRFGEVMAVELVNDGPFTIWLDSDAG